MIATTFATMALECIVEGIDGKMMAIQKGCYCVTDIPDPSLGPREVDIETMYNTERYRPNYSKKNGLPVFMTRLD